MKILVTGDRGFIGRYLTKRLIENGHKLIGLDKMPLNNERFPYIVHEGNILDFGKLCAVAEGVECIIHLAAEHQDFGVSRKDFFDVNVEGTKKVLCVAAQRKINRIIYYSSVAVYGLTEIYTTEETQPNPNNDYGESKLKAEEEVRSWISERPQRQAVIIRPTVVFGPFNYANMFNLINSIYKKRFVFVGRGNNIKSVAYVENLIAATIFLLERLTPGLEVYNYSDYPQMTIAQIVTTISHYLPVNLPKFKIPLVPALTTASVFDILAKLTGYNFPITSYRIKKFNTPTHHESEKIRQLGFKPSIELSEGFERTVEWYLNNSRGEVCMSSF